ncbi:uncharacterized protein FA14DRAFT_68765 [Meira miltonrushii]|uniref:Uncharacterized protein n=1 Tax=Meira miltonrushii TaxID=1280837 RepID=A0A316VD14_9BASI|nr:uncharacterized protein FA14DRAFT_68765 [Meira miltonrushii]PWN34123.1 hypothetical protein FA14DRAFT_68765 [Meira miltonrushii]
MEKGKGREDRNGVVSSASPNHQTQEVEGKEQVLTLQEDREEINQGIEQKLSMLHERERGMLSELYQTEIEKQVLLNARTLIDERLRKVQHRQYLSRAAKVGKKANSEEDLTKE